MTPRPTVDWTDEFDSVKLEELSVDGLTQRMYFFRLTPRGFVVSQYAVQTRATKRAKWEVQVSYSALFTAPPYSTIKKEEIPLGPGIRATLREALANRVWRVPITLADPTDRL
jgi:hypothetical protein